MNTPVAVVTGAGAGIGAATALAFASAGYTLVVCGRRVEPLRETQQQVEQAGALCLVRAADVGDAKAIDGLVQVAVERFGRIDVWVNNAGVATVAGIGRIELTDIDAMVRINAAGVAYACRAVWPVMQRGGGGTIINISSVASSDPFPGLEVYGATKAFVNLLTKGLAAEGKPHNIHVFAVAPGAVETKMLRGSFPDIPAEECLAPAEVADLIVALTTPPFRHCTGQTIAVRR
jgi:NADP-dependent 3-hydroxy acid dehydrogenase YdfG